MTFEGFAPIDFTRLYDDEVLMHHKRDTCAGEACCLHNPSDHPLRDAPLDWRRYVMFRVCEHGRRHPDPDDSAWRRRTGQAVHATHACDGCCGYALAAGMLAEAIASTALDGDTRTLDEQIAADPEVTTAELLSAALDAAIAANTRTLLDAARGPLDDGNDLTERLQHTYAQRSYAEGKAVGYDEGLADGRRIAWVTIREAITGALAATEPAR